MSAFCTSSLKQKLAFKLYYNPLLHFCAVLGIRAEQRAWKPARDYTGQLAGLLWCARLLMLEHIFHGQPEEPEEMEEMPVDMVERFKEEHRTWLADGSHTLFSTIIRWMSYGEGYRKREGGSARLLWEKDRQTLRYLRQAIRVEEFGRAVRVAVQEAEALMDRVVFGGWEELQGRLELGQVEDSLMFEGRAHYLRPTRATTGCSPGSGGWPYGGSRRCGGRAGVGGWARSYNIWTRCRRSRRRCWAIRTSGRGSPAGARR